MHSVTTSLSLSDFPQNPRPPKRNKVEEVVQELYERRVEMVKPAVAQAMAHREWCWDWFGMAMADQVGSGYQLKGVFEDSSDVFEVALTHYLTGPKAARNLMAKRLLSRGKLAFDQLCTTIRKAEQNTLIQIASYGEKAFRLIYTLSLNHVKRWDNIVAIGDGKYHKINAEEIKTVTYRELIHDLKYLREHMAYSIFQNRCRPEKIRTPTLQKKVIKLSLPVEPCWRHISKRVQPVVLHAIRCIHSFARFPSTGIRSIMNMEWTRCGFTSNYLLDVLIDPGVGSTSSNKKIFEMMKAEEKRLLKSPLQNTYNCAIITLNGGIQLSTGDFIELNHELLILQYPYQGESVEVRYLVAQSYLHMYRLIDWLQYRRAESGNSDGSYSSDEFWSDFMAPIKEFASSDPDPLTCAKTYLKLFLAPNNLKLQSYDKASIIWKLHFAASFKRLK